MDDEEDQPIGEYPAIPEGPGEAEVKCAVCQRIYHVRADAPGWSAVWTSCISCQANEETDWLNRDYD